MNRTIDPRLWALAAVFLGACSCDGNESTDSPDGSGGSASSLPNGSGGSASSVPNGSGGADGGSAAAFMSGSTATGMGGGLCGTDLTGTIRDFMVSHPDFEDYNGDDKGIVLADLGPDNKPVHASRGGTPTTTSKESFDQWFHDTPGVNMSVAHTIGLVDNGEGIYTFNDNEFFPIDDQLFGNEGNPHNYHFTFELHTQFLYQGGEVFSFTGDDDLFVFINKKLAIDLGGVHGAESDSVDLDAEAGALGLAKGGTYQLDFFFAERHTVDSHFRIDTTLTFVDCGMPR